MSSEIVSSLRQPTLLLSGRQHPDSRLCEAGPGVAGVARPGHAFKGISREPRRAPCLCRMVGVGPAQPKHDQVPGDEGSPHRKRTNPQREKPAAKGNRRQQLRADEQSYEPIVPMKVENRRAPARGGHGIHWREGANRSTYRRRATWPRHRTRRTMSNGTEPNS